MADKSFEGNQKLKTDKFQFIGEFNCTHFNKLYALFMGCTQIVSKEVFTHKIKARIYGYPIRDF